MGQVTRFRNTAYAVLLAATPVAAQTEGAPFRMPLPAEDMAKLDPDYLPDLARFEKVFAACMEENDRKSSAFLSKASPEEVERFIAGGNKYPFATEVVIDGKVAGFCSRQLEFDRNIDQMLAEHKAQNGNTPLRDATGEIVTRKLQDRGCFGFVSDGEWQKSKSHVFSYDSLSYHYDMKTGKDDFNWKDGSASLSVDYGPMTHANFETRYRLEPPRIDANTGASIPALFYRQIRSAGAEWRYTPDDRTKSHPFYFRRNPMEPENRNDGKEYVPEEIAKRVEPFIGRLKSMCEPSG